MKTRISVAVCLAMGLGLFSSLRMARADTSDVYRVSINLQGKFQHFASIAGVRLHTSDLLNFALGRIQTNRVSPNEILAIAVNCASNQDRLIVFNKATSSNLATVATITELPGGATVSNAARAVVIYDMQFQPTGATSNAITGGDLFLAAHRNFNKSHCPTTIGAKMIGTLDLIVRGEAVQVVVTNAGLATVGKVGKLVE